MLLSGKGASRRDSATERGKRMSLRRIGLRAALSILAASVSAAAAAIPALAEAPTKICVPETPSKPVLSASAKNECPTKSTTKYKTEALPGPVELETLDKILPHVNFVESGVGGKPTIQFSGANIQIVNGEGKTRTANGAGNLVIGYDENPESRAQTGSHNLVVGAEQGFTSFGGIVAGRLNFISGAFASVTGGDGNFATGETSSVSGGLGNVAFEFDGSISGGQFNEAGFIGSVSGGSFNKAITGGSNWVGGGTKNAASGAIATISGGKENEATGEAAHVGGGLKNTAEGKFSAVFGGKGLTAKNEFEAIP